MTVGEGKFTIHWIGRRSTATSNGMVNEHIVAALSQLGHKVVLSKQIDIKQQVDIVVHHDMLADFSSLKLPGNPKPIAFRTWDFGPYPPDWIDKINNDFQQLWVYSEWTLRQALNSGLAEEKVRKVSLGIQSDIFSENGDNLFNINSEKGFRFLFVGAAVQRKGIDVLLKAFKLAFSARDDVCLVIKDFVSNPLYRNTYEQKAITKYQEEKNNPELIYLDKHLSPIELAALYRSCQFGVFPYRAEGFGVPILESMACGTPCLVPRFGPCLDFCSESSALFVEHREISLPIEKKFTYNSLGYETRISEINICEVDPEDLAKKMRIAYEMEQKQYQKLSTISAQNARNFTWGNAAHSIEKHLFELL